jgi:hypothetical protein
MRTAEFAVVAATLTGARGENDADDNRGGTGADGAETRRRGGTH